jgi:predicted dehydrogenase
MTRVAIVGCGKIADDHASQIRRIGSAEIVAACDRELLMARQLCQRFPIANYYSDMSRMLSEAHPDVVHITTPPQSHYALAKACLEAGCHVYVEKPFTLNEHEATALIRLAETSNLRVTVGHDDQFRHAARRMRSLVKSGYLGGSPLHMESYYCYEIGRVGYVGALLGDKRHWVRGLPGKLLHNIISHGIARIAEFLATESPHVIAHGFTSPLLRSMGESEIVDELRVIVSEEDRTTAYFTFSSQMRPSLHQFRLYGPKAGLVFDQDQETLIKLPGTKLKSYASHFVSPIGLASQHVGNVFSNLRTFLRNDFHMKSGMKFLIESFYHSIAYGGPPPIPYREILLTARIMDLIFCQLETQAPLRGPGTSQTSEADAAVDS